LHSNPYTFHLLSQPTFVPSLDTPGPNNIDQSGV
jgi:hypothetical protein